MMNKCFKRILILILVVMIAFLPNCVYAKEFDFGSFYESDALIFDGDKFIANGYEYICGSKQCTTCVEEWHLELGSVIYDHVVYELENTTGVSVNKTDGYVFNYRNLANLVIEDDNFSISVCDENGKYIRSGNDDDVILIKNLLKDESKVPYVMFDKPITSSRECFWGHTLKFDYDTKVTLNLDYLNLEGANHENPVSYKKEDGTIVLKELQREGYTFEGWYLDSDYKFRVTELTEEFVNNYFSNSGDFKYIDKIPVKDENGTIIGKIDLYAKWTANKPIDKTFTGISSIVNPQTLAPIGIVVGVLLIVGIVTGVVLFRKRKNNKDIL